MKNKWARNRKRTTGIATTNSRQILSDPTGSRRYLCVEVTDMISNESIEHKQFYAQLKQEVLDGERDYLNKEEEKGYHVVQAEAA